MYYYRTVYPFFAIQSEYFTVYQCFLTHRSLYLVVWNVADGEQGLRDLQPWLENIEVTYMSSILYHIKYFPSADDTSTSPQHLVCRVVQSLHMQMSIIEVSICRRPHMDTSMILICIWLVCRLCTTLHTKCCGAVFPSRITLSWHCLNRLPLSHQARAPGSPVIVIGTHGDSAAHGSGAYEGLEKLFRELYIQYNASRFAYPLFIHQKCIIVSSFDSTQVSHLRKTIYEVATSYRPAGELAFRI